jgi:hypothetical protein
MNLFQDFDFRALETPGYSEDSVRENIVNPILRQLGYGTSGPHQVIPAKAVSQPLPVPGRFPAQGQHPPRLPAPG